MKTFSTFLMVILFLACQTKKDAALKTPIIFQSSNNGLADIKLSILPRHTFQFSMSTIPQAMENKTSTSVTKTNGTWLSKGNLILLSFDDHSFDTKAVFLTVNDQNKVEINLNDSSISIWGINCDKTIQK